MDDNTTAGSGPIPAWDAGEAIHPPVARKLFKVSETMLRWLRHIESGRVVFAEQMGSRSYDALSRRRLITDTKSGRLDITPAGWALLSVSK